MALFGAIAAAAGSVGQALDVANQLLQNQVSIEAQDGSNIVYINVTESEDLETVIQVTEKPIADLGGGLDALSRTSTPLIISGILSNRNLDLRRASLGTALGVAAAYNPQAAGIFRQSAETLGKFVDVGTEEQIRTLQLLTQWQNDGMLVKVRGVKLDFRKITRSKNDIFWFIENIKSVFTPDTGDGIALTISLKNVVLIDSPEKGGVTGVRGVLERFISLPSNPFSGNIIS